MKSFKFARTNYWSLVITVAFIASLSRMTWIIPPIPAGISVSTISVVCLIGILGNWIGSKSREKLTKLKRNLFLPYCLYLFWAILSLFWTMNFPSSFGQVALFMCVSGFAFTTYLWRWNTHLQIKRDLSWLFFLISFISIIGLALAFFGIKVVFGDYGRLYGIFLNPGVTGTIAALSVLLGIFLISEGSGAFTWYISFGISVGIATALASGTKGALLALLFGLVVAFYKSIGQRLIIILFSVLGGVLIWLPIFFGFIGPNRLLSDDALDVSGPNYPELTESVISNFSISDTAFNRLPSSDFTSGRIAIFQKAISVASENLAFGHGFRTTKLLPEFNGMEAHNSYLGILLELGLVGIILLGWFIFQMFKSGGPSILIGIPIFFILKEASDSMFLGSGGPIALIYWICLFAYARWGEVARSSFSIKDWLKPGQPNNLRTNLAH